MSSASGKFSDFGGPPTAGAARGDGRPLGGVPSLEDVRRVLSRSDKARPSTIEEGQGLLVTACGRTIGVPDGAGNTLLLHHVQKSLQDELALPEQAFDIHDRNGTRLRTDQDLREAVMSGRVPLNGKLSDTSAKISAIQSDIKWVCQQVGSLRGELESQKQEHNQAVDGLRSELYSLIESAKFSGNDGQGTGLDGFSALSTDQGMSLASQEQIANLEYDIRHLGQKLDESTHHFRNTMSEYSRHHDRASTQNSDAIARLVDRCAGLDTRVANAEMGMASVGMRPKPREGPMAPNPAVPAPFNRSLEPNAGTRSLEPGSLNRGGPGGPYNNQIRGGSNVSESGALNQSVDRDVLNQSVDRGGLNQSVGAVPGPQSRFTGTSPHHSPEPAARNSGLLDRIAPARLGVAASQSPSRGHGIGGAYGGAGRPGGPGFSGGNSPGGGQTSLDGGRLGSGSVGLPGSAKATIPGRLSAGAPASGAYHGGSGLFSAGPSQQQGGGGSGGSPTNMPPRGINRSQSPRFPGSEKGGSALGMRAATPAGGQNPAPGMPRASRPTSAATSEQSTPSVVRSQTAAP